MPISKEKASNPDNLERYIEGLFPEYAIERLQKERDLVQVIPDNLAEVESIITTIKEKTPEYINTSRLEESVIIWCE